MCGRFTLTVSLEELLRIVKTRYDIFDLDMSGYRPRYNIAPSQEVWAIIHDGTKYRLGKLKWGLVPPYAEDVKIGYSLINAKAETLMYKPSFKPSLEKRRCIILADGFYEWQKTDSGKLPHRFIVSDQPLIAFAGLWSSFTQKDGKKLYTCAIITTKANNVMAPIHDRMPVILDEKEQQMWLKNEHSDLKSLTSILVPYPSEKMERYQVSKIVNNPFIDTEEMINGV
jgi:putative SOS response-associated peptidase YedK